ncbi:hypothetical protein Tco_0514799 [Tanacetum coccineum]
MVLWNHAMVGAGHAAYTDRFHELARLVPHLVTPESRMIERYVYGLDPQIRGMVAATEPKTMQKAVQISGALTDEADCRGVSRNVNPVNARNPTVRACYECGSTDHVRLACPRLNRAQEPEGNRPNQVDANNGVRVVETKGTRLGVGHSWLGAEEARLDLKHCDGRTWGCVCKWQPYGCSYKEFLACNPKEYDGKGGIVVLTRWIKKMENVQDMSGCSNDQKVKYTAGLFVVAKVGILSSGIRMVGAGMCNILLGLHELASGWMVRAATETKDYAEGSVDFWCTDR